MEKIIGKPRREAAGTLVAWNTIGEATGIKGARQVRQWKNTLTMI